MFFYDSTYIIMIPALIFAMWAEHRVNSSFRKYSMQRSMRNLTGAQAARIMLDSNGLNNVQIRPIGGHLSDNYNPSKRTLNLSPDVYNETSISAISVACHEAGHAVQHSKHYAPLTFRNAIVPVVNFASALTWPMIAIGLLLTFSASTAYIGSTVFNAGLIAFLIIILFHTVTLPVEFDASRRALVQMEELGIVSSEEKTGAKRVLRAAALTYVAGLAIAVANLLRIIAIKNRND